MNPMCEPVQSSQRSNHSIQRLARHARERAALHEALLALAEADPRVIPLGPDPLVENLEQVLRMSSDGLAILRIKTGRRFITVVAIPRRIWHRPSHKRKLLSLKALSRKLGVRVLLVPAAWVRREPRLGNARIVASCAGLAVSPADQDRILRRIQNRPGITIEDCSDAVEGKDPLGCILHLVANGKVLINPADGIAPFSRLRLA